MVIAFVGSDGYSDGDLETYEDDGDWYGDWEEWEMEDAYDQYTGDMTFEEFADYVITNGHTPPDDGERDEYDTPEDYE